MFAFLLMGLAGMALAQEPADQTQGSETISQEETITAQDLGVGEPTILSDSKFYFLKNWQRAVQSVFAFSQEKKAELNLKIASEKLLEARKLAEKTNNSQVLEKATDLYNAQLSKIQENIAKFKGTATSSEKVSEFLDKYAKQQLLHTQILEKLEGKVPSSTMEKIEQARERHLEQFGQVMQKLEDKNQIQQRLEKALDSLKNSDLKDVKNLELLKELKEKFPTSSKDQIQQSIESGLNQIREKMQLMPQADQEKIATYLEKAQGAVERKMEIINDIKNILPDSSAIKQKMETAKEKLQNTINNRIGKDCICTMEYSPVCGKNGITYANPCRAKCQNIEIASQGPCLNQATTSPNNIVGGDKDEHGCIGSAGYTWCEAKQKCLRAWEEKCQIEQEKNQNQEQNQNNQGQ